MLLKCSQKVWIVADMLQYYEIARFFKNSSFNRIFCHLQFELQLKYKVKSIIQGLQRNSLIISQKQEQITEYSISDSKAHQLSKIIKHLYIDFVILR